MSPPCLTDPIGLGTTVFGKHFPGQAWYFMIGIVTSVIGLTGLVAS